MDTISTQQALQELLYHPDFLARWLTAGLTKADRRRIRHRLKNQQLSLDLQEELLERTGFSVAQEKHWREPALKQAVK